MAIKTTVVTIIAVTCGILLVGLVYIRLYLDRHLESMLAAALGREVRIEQGLSLHWSRSPGITLKGLWIGNPQWSSGEYLARAERATVMLSTSALLQRRLELEQVMVQNADVALEVAADGRQNWSFGGDNAGEETPGVAVNELRIENSQLSYRSSDGVAYRLGIAGIGYRKPPGGPPEVETDFTYRNTLIRISTAPAKPQDQKSPGWPLSGRIEIPESPAIEMAAQLQITDCCLQLTQIEVTSDGSDISGELSFPLTQEGRIGGSLNSNLLDLQPYLSRSGQPEDKALPLLQRELPEDILQGFNGALKLSIGRLLLDTYELEQFEADADLEDSHLKLILGAENRRLSADIDLKPAKRGWQASVQHSGKLELSELINSAQHGGDATRAPLEVEFNLRGTGSSLNDLIQSGRGQFLMVVGEGRLSKAVSAKLPLGDVIYTLLGAILPQEQIGDQSRLECAVMQFDIAEGVATSSKGLALRTGQLNVLGGGAVNLRSGKIQFRFKTAPRRGLGIGFLGVADRLFDVTGTLQKPTAALSMERTVTFGAMTWATSGLNILASSILSRLSASSNPCEMVLRGGK
ncbi:hypothetical protein GCM10011348_02780 [Marinobacterium nitratireducens]|uniref:AsmA domain-containing protein n=1 Tax=Marinobacterium nitratireducens TaxID=518897 RepID=A0A917Z662_9GAMM|nr:AsmA family protein [Marinobacterium nitratireducens]GGO76182.1 hypothetical protein GCM10011348_02780 [Marinobacterium nitratireducens]